MPKSPFEDITTRGTDNIPKTPAADSAVIPAKNSIAKSTVPAPTTVPAAAPPDKPKPSAAVQAAAATNISRLFRGQQARTKYTFKSIDTAHLADYKAFIYGNDPSFTADLLKKDLEIRPNRETPFVFIGMACLKNLSVVLALAAAPSPNAAPAGSASPTPVGSASPTPVGSASPTPVGSASPTPVGSASPTPVGSASPVPVGSASPVPLATADNAPHLHTIPRILIIDNSAHVKNFWTIFKSYFAKTNEEEFLKNLMDEFLSELMDKDVFTEGDITSFKRYMTDLFTKFGYENVKALVERVKFVGQDWGDARTFKVIKNLITFGDSANKGPKTVVYAYPSNIPACCVKLEEDNKAALKVLSNLNALKPDLAIHTNLVGRTGRMHPTQVHLLTEHSPDNVAKILDLPLATTADLTNKST